MTIYLKRNWVSDMFIIVCPGHPRSPHPHKCGHILCHVILLQTANWLGTDTGANGSTVKMKNVPVSQALKTENWGGHQSSHIPAEGLKGYRPLVRMDCMQFQFYPEK